MANIQTVTEVSVFIRKNHLLALWVSVCLLCFLRHFGWYCSENKRYLKLGFYPVSEDIVKNPSLFLQQCTFTMHRPRVHSISQYIKLHFLVNP